MKKSFLRRLILILGSLCLSLIILQLSSFKPASSAQAAAPSPSLYQDLKLNQLKQGLKQYQIMTEGSPEQIGKHITQLIFKVAISVSGAIFVILLLIGGIQYLVSAGNDEATSKAKRMLLDAIIGLFITLASYAFGSWLINLLK